MKGHKTVRGRSTKHKVLLVDDHPVVREGLARRINCERDLTVCGEAETARDALRAIASLRPDIVVVDLSLPRGHGLELIKDLKILHPKLRVLVFTMHDESLFAERALRAGARGYVMKQEPPNRLLAAIRTVLKGDYFLSERTSTEFLGTFLRQSARNTAASVTRLTDRDGDASDRPGVGGLRTHRPGSGHERDRQPARPQRQDNRDPPPPHQSEAGVEIRRPTGLLRQSLGGVRKRGRESAVRRTAMGDTPGWTTGGCPESEMRVRLQVGLYPIASNKFLMDRSA